MQKGSTTNVLDSQLLSYSECSEPFYFNSELP